MLDSIRPRTRRGWTAMVVPLVLALGASVVAWVGTRPDDLPEGAAFRVGDEVVTIDALERRVQSLRALYGVEPPDGGPELARFRRDAAKAVAVGMVLDAAATRRGLVISEKEARDTLTRFIERQYPVGGRSQFAQVLGSVGASEQDVLAEIRRQLTIMRLYDRVTADSGAARDQEVRAYFARHRDRLGAPERRRLRNIVVATRAEGYRLAERLRAGTSFPTLARRVSLDASTRARGGSLGALGAADLEPGYAEAAFSAAPGQVFGPVRTRHGWNVGMVEAVLPSRPPKYGQVKEELAEQVRTEHQVRAWRDWLRQQIHQADIDYAPAYRPARPGAPPTFPGTAVPGGTP